MILVTPSSVDVTAGPRRSSPSTPTRRVEPAERRLRQPGRGDPATEYLIALGHRRIGFLAGRPDLESARLREQGYREALAAAGIELDPDAGPRRRLRPETAEEPARELLALDEPPTAIFAANDVSAIETMDVAHSLGLSVPDDVSVIGFDNIPESALTEPPLTTIDQSIQQHGPRGRADADRPDRRRRPPGSQVDAADPARRAPLLPRRSETRRDDRRQRGRRRYRDPTRTVDERVDDLLARMTREEKVAQLGSAWVFQLADGAELDRASAGAAGARHRADHAHLRREQPRRRAGGRGWPTRSSATSSSRRGSASRRSSTRRSARA